ncbi:MAG: hypothetical protein KDJ90_24680, partial [Nitratireductor sp.]|nr:hypothetical protein [Nitratireductor sp.]
ARALALLALIVVPLSGCMSTGASSFTNTAAPNARTASVSSSQAPQTLPLAVADDSGADPSVNMAMQRPSGTEAGDLQALVPAGEAPPGAIGGQFASLQSQGQVSGNSLYAPVRKVSFEPGQSGISVRLLDPADQAAEERIPGLYASIDHGECKGGWGPKPNLVNAERVAQGDPYYMEMRLRRTPMLPVGHVYIAYGRLSPQGEPLDEKLVMLAPLGGYGGAAVAAAIPMPGVLKPYGDDCVLNPIAAYRISLTPSKFEQLLLEVERQKKKKPAYALFAYNCNHFMSDVAKSVGILPPENIYEPSLSYFYSMMDRNEGRKVPRTVAELKKEKMRFASAARLPVQ